MDLKIFKAYDIRGVYPDQIDEDSVYRIGQAYVDVVKPSKPVVVGMDVRIHSQKLKDSLIESLLDMGVDVWDIGLVSTEMLYFSVGYYDLAGGIQVTASHNPAEYNGLKMTREKVIPLSFSSGISEIKDIVLDNKQKTVKQKRGQITKKDVFQDYAQFVLNFINKEKIKPFKLAYNPSFGYQGVILEKIVDFFNLPLQLKGLNHVPDGTFPKGSPDPFRLENRPEFNEFTKKSNVDLGVSWDADGDRVFFCTGEGVFVEPYFSNSILIKYFLNKDKKGKIIYDPRYTWALIDAANQAGGQAIMERVGHSFIKERMRKENAIFAGESSGHVYLRDFWYADSGIIPLLIMLEIISQGDSLQEKLEPLFNKYFISGEINFKVDDADQSINKLKKKYNDAEITEIDGLSIDYNDWRTNIRKSNTEPLLRVNIEGKTKEIVQEKKKEIINLVENN